MPHTIVGIDPSLSSTGLYIYDNETKACQGYQIDGHVQSRHVGDRCESIAIYLAEKAKPAMASAILNVFIEEPSGALQGYAQDLRTLYWAIIRQLENIAFACFNTYPVSPKTLNKFLTGNGNCAAENKTLAILTKYRQYIPEEYVVSSDTKGGLMKYKDLYDAIGLALLGDCLLGGDGYTKLQKESLKKVTKL
jgi:hypothetical protein